MTKTSKFQMVYEQLVHNSKTIETFIAGISQEDSRWKSSPKKWSILEVMNHLKDEEQKDFRPRIDILLNFSDKTWEPNNPDMWVLENDYNNQDLKETLSVFKEERQKSLIWLKSLNLSEADWEKAYQHPKFGPIPLECVLCSWPAHDLLHIKQMLRVQWDFLASKMSNPENLQYAGQW